MSHRTTVTRACLALVLAGAGVLGGGSPALGVDHLSVPKGATIAIHGRGYGHGHGMSQYGAQGAAKQGLSTAAILHFYYPRTKAGHVAGSVRVLLTATIGEATVVVDRPGLQVRDLTRGTTTRVPTSGRAATATQWRMTGDGSGGTQVSYRTDTWHPWRTLEGNGEFRSSGAALTLVVGGSRVTYRGTLRSMAPISATTHRITVNKVSLEGYVRGVVPREMPASWRPAALRAQAVAARTYAAFEVRDSSDPRFNLCDSTSCQVYGGLSAETTATNAATDATAGTVRTFKGHPAFTQFSASNGGWLAPGGRPYLVGKKDPYDTAAVDPYSAWTVKVTATRIQRTWPRLGRLTSIDVTERDGSGRWGGRILALTLRGTQGHKALSGDEFRSAFGLRSTYLDFTLVR
jgi:SpoIID/LytB domain protein